jgi:hypothetical protein
MTAATCVLIVDHPIPSVDQGAWFGAAIKRIAYCTQS